METTMELQQVTPQQVFELLLPLTPAQQRDFLAEVQGRFNEYYRDQITNREQELEEAHKRRDIFQEVPGPSPIKMGANYTDHNAKTLR